MYQDEQMTFVWL